LARVLLDRGFKRVRALHGGFQAWQEAGPADPADRVSPFSGEIFLRSAHEFAERTDSRATSHGPPKTAASPQAGQPADSSALVIVPKAAEPATPLGAPRFGRIEQIEDLGAKVRFAVPERSGTRRNQRKVDVAVRRSTHGVACRIANREGTGAMAKTRWY